MPTKPGALAAVLLSLTAALIGPAGRAAAQDRETDGPVVLKLRELGMEIQRQKVRVPGTSRVERVSRLRRADGTLEDLRDEDVLELIRDDAERYRARAGALHRSLLDRVTRAGVENPTRVFPVAILARFDPSQLPRRLSPDETRRLGAAERDAVDKERARRLQQIAADSTREVHAALGRLSPRSVKPSRIAPIVYAELTASELLQLAREQAVATIFDSSHKMVPELGTSTCATGATTVQARGISAGHVEVAVLEPDQVDHPLNCLDVINWLDDSDIARHPTGVAGIVASTLAGTTGVAPGANILSADIDDSLSPVSNLEDGLIWAYDAGADVVNMSFGMDDDGYVEAEDVLVDYFVRNWARTVVKSAGNISNTCTDTLQVTNPGMGFNMITVGNYDDMGNCDTANDVISTDSCYGDPESLHGDRQKPEVAAPGTNITTLDWSNSSSCMTRTGSGTSFAAPHVSGTAALLIARDITYKEWPELAKATIMASAFNNVEGGRRLSEKDGAGGIDSAAADDIARKGRWWASHVTGSDFSAGGWKTLAQFTVKPLTSRLKVAVTWDSNPGDEAFSNPNDFAISNDFDLYLHRLGTPDPVAESKSWDNSYETVDILNPPAGTYEIRVHVWGSMTVFPTAGEYLATAWGLIEHPCADLGGDSDLDGICGNVDNCPKVANNTQTDSDGDGVGNTCDNCPSTSNASQKDDDHDGIGNVCDNDDDNDGCKDWEDHNPSSPMEVSGKWIGPFCNPSSGLTYAFAGVDTDGDGLLNCKDSDNDNDGTPDASDGCPLTSGQFCTIFKDCPVQDVFFMCGLQCVEFLLKVVEVINPDPTKEVIFETFQVVEGKLYLQPLAGKSLEESAQALAGDGSVVPSTPLAALAEGTSRRRLEIWSRATESAPSRLVSTVAEYDPSTVVVGALTPGRILQVVLPGSDGSPMTVAATWVAGADPGTPLADADGDGIPDAFDEAPAALDCSRATASLPSLWPPSHHLAEVRVQGVTDGSGRPLSVRIEGVTQDEPTGGPAAKRVCPDASGIGLPSVMLRAERDARGDGRVYGVSFSARDEAGATCQGRVTVCVPHAAGGTCVDSGQTVDSLDCSK